MARGAVYKGIAPLLLPRLVNFGININPVHFGVPSIIVYEFYLILRFLWFRFDQTNWNAYIATKHFFYELPSWNLELQTMSQRRKMKSIYFKVRDLVVNNFLSGLKDIIDLWLDQTLSGARFRLTWITRTRTDPSEWLITRKVIRPNIFRAEIPPVSQDSSFLNHFRDFLKTPKYVKHIWRYNLNTIPPSELANYNTTRLTGSVEWTIFWSSLQNVIWHVGPRMLQHSLQHKGHRWIESNLQELFAQTSPLTFNMMAPIQVSHLTASGLGGMRASIYSQLQYSVDDRPASFQPDISLSTFTDVWDPTIDW
jgi:hypothetical protein